MTGIKQFRKRKEGGNTQKIWLGFRRTGRAAAGHMLGLMNKRA